MGGQRYRYEDGPEILRLGLLSHALCSDSQKQADSLAGIAEPCKFMLARAVKCEGVFCFDIPPGGSRNS